jgi:hypothetical protein
VSSLVAGILFVGVAIAWVLFEAGAIDLADLGWLLPSLLIGAGAVGVTVSIRRGSGRSRRS